MGLTKKFHDSNGFSARRYAFLSPTVCTRICTEGACQHFDWWASMISLETGRKAFHIFQAQLQHFSRAFQATSAAKCKAWRISRTATPQALAWQSWLLFAAIAIANLCESWPSLRATDAQPSTWLFEKCMLNKQNETEPTGEKIALCKGSEGHTRELKSLPCHGLTFYSLDAASKQNECGNFELFESGLASARTQDGATLLTCTILPWFCSYLLMSFNSHLPLEENRSWPGELATISATSLQFNFQFLLSYSTSPSLAPKPGNSREAEIAHESGTRPSRQP